MVKPKDGQTRIRITESAGVHPALMVIASVVGGVALGGFIASAILPEGAPIVLTASVMVAAFGTTYFGARKAFAGFIRRRVRILSHLMNRLSHQVAGAQTRSRQLSDASGEGRREQGSPGQ